MLMLNLEMTATHGFSLFEPIVAVAPTLGGLNTASYLLLRKAFIRFKIKHLPYMSQHKRRHFLISAFLCFITSENILSYLSVT